MDGFTLIGKLLSVQVTSWVNLPPQSTNYHFALFKKSGQVSSPFERGSKTSCAGSINSTLEVCWLHTKARMKTAYPIQQEKEVQANQGFYVMWTPPPMDISLFQFLLFLTMICSL